MNPKPHLDFSAERHYLEHYINKLFRFQVWMRYNEEYDFTEMEDALIEAIELMKEKYKAETNGKNPEIQDPRYAWTPRPGYKRWEREV